ncbi:MAG TPA: hypothetical protein VHD90_01875 [Phototrophicaceae bacterium]|nr:hypothetical protein [Phototrophicaceae bacterium]
MSPDRFHAKLAQKQQTGGNRGLLLNPRVTQLPLPIARFDDPFLPFGKAIISATHDLVCAYVFDLAAYLALGGAGAVALERTIAYAGDEAVTILHGPFTGTGYVEAAQAFGVDAVTLEDEINAEVYRAAGLGVFVVGSRLEGVIAPIGSSLTIRLADEHLIEAGRGDDFAEQVQSALQGQP